MANYLAHAAADSYSEPSPTSFVLLSKAVHKQANPKLEPLVRPLFWRSHRPDNAANPMYPAPPHVHNSPHAGTTNLKAGPITYLHPSVTAIAKLTTGTRYNHSRIAPPIVISWLAKRPLVRHSQLLRPSKLI